MRCSRSRVLSSKYRPPSSIYDAKALIANDNRGLAAHLIRHQILPIGQCHVGHFIYEEALNNLERVEERIIQNYRVFQIVSTVQCRGGRAFIILSAND